MADQSLQQKPGLRCCPQKVCEFNLALVLSGAFWCPAQPQATTPRSHSPWCHQPGNHSAQLSSEQRIPACQPPSAPPPPGDAARKPSPPGPTRRPDTRSSSAAGGLSEASPASPNRSCSVTALPWTLSSRSGSPLACRTKPCQARALPHFLHAGGRACLSVHPSLAWFSGSGTLSLRVKGWDPLPMAQPGKPGPDVRAPPGMQSRGHGNGAFPAGPRPRASAPCAGRCPAAPESRLGREP